MSALEVIEPGESYEFSFGLDDDASINDYTCEITLKQHPDDTPILTRTITPTGNVFSGFLTKTETESLDPGLYYLVANMTNTSLDKKVVRRETSRFRVTKAWT